MHVAPWELLDQPSCWRDYALIAESAENTAEMKAHERAQQKAKTR